MTIENPTFFASSYIWLAYIFEASYSTVVTSVSKKSSVDQSELEKEVVSHCQIYCMFHWTPLVTASGSFINSKMFFWKILSKVLTLFHNKILSNWLFSTNSVFSIFHKQKLIIVFWGLSLNKIVPASEAALKILKFFNGRILVLSNTTSVSSPKVKKGALTKRIYEICTSTVCPYA